jgi:hypothetical protein
MTDPDAELSAITAAEHARVREMLLLVECPTHGRHINEARVYAAIIAGHAGRALDTLALTMPDCPRCLHAMVYVLALKAASGNGSAASYGSVYDAIGALMRELLRTLNLVASDVESGTLTSAAGE